MIPVLTRSSDFSLPFSPFLSLTGRELKGIKVTVRNDPTSPIFTSSTSGGIRFGGRGIDIARERTVTPVRNVDKHTGEVETTYVRCKNFFKSIGGYFTLFSLIFLAIVYPCNWIEHPLIYPFTAADRC